MDHQYGKPVEILLVEDNPGDAKLATVALHKAKVSNRITHVEDGVEAMDYLHQRGKYAGAARPDLILLDLNLPRKDGREVLEEIKIDDVLKRIPVVVLTVSSAEEDILKSYNLHANCFITKPIDINRFMEVVQQIESFWLTIVSLPDGN
jgi:two-component system response regulator